MWAKHQNPSLEVHCECASLQLTIFILDETGYILSSSSNPHVTTQGIVLMERYELGRLLGQGTFAKVYYGRNTRTGQGVAIKVIDKEKVLRVGLTNQIKREISIMRLVKHPNILELYEVMATKTKIYFALEYAKGGELFDKVSKGRLKEQIARKYFQQLINAVDFCHSRGVYHRDLKPENLLLDENDNLKVSDFGLSALAESKHQDGLLHTTCGTPAYVAPEVINRKGYEGDKADIWSCGVILYVLLTGHLPFHDSNLMEMYRKIGKAEFKCPNWFPPEVKRLLTRMLEPNPEYRITIAKIKENTWFKKSTNVRKSRNETKNKDSDSSDRASGSSEQKQEMNISKREAGLLKLEATKEGRKGILSIDTEVFEFTNSFHMVEVKKSNGDTLEYQKVSDYVAYSYVTFILAYVIVL
ncbi:hypothetical protein E3N88_21880 [Mikania micrantha]|uniref:Protein kinase domain-containing protein n=1 Tax=Mikania micrantha TaxID=192012 RepID=A0A5N6N9X2_9ASTR|nr:hypothetical protein E3N88_21880 [Mikania micrantha]